MLCYHNVFTWWRCRAIVVVVGQLWRAHVCCHTPLCVTQQVGKHGFGAWGWVRRTRQGFVERR